MKMTFLEAIENLKMEFFNAIRIPQIVEWVSKHLPDRVGEQSITTHNMKMEITIEVRESGISIQGAGVGNNQALVRDILKTALDSLNSDRERVVLKNEIVIKK